MLYEYPCRVERVVDGDTLVVFVDKGTDDFKRMTLRLFGINAPELKTPEGVAARNWVLKELSDRGWFGAEFPVALRTVKDHTEKYGRYLAVLVDRNTGWVLNDELVKSGNAVVKKY